MTDDPFDGTVGRKNGELCGHLNVNAARRLGGRFAEARTEFEECAYGVSDSEDAHEMPSPFTCHVSLGRRPRPTENQIRLARWIRANDSAIVDKISELFFIEYVRLAMFCSKQLGVEVGHVGFLPHPHSAEHTDALILIGAISLSPESDLIGLELSCAFLDGHPLGVQIIGRSSFKVGGAGTAYVSEV